MKIDSTPNPIQAVNVKPAAAKSENLHESKQKPEASARNLGQGRMIKWFAQVGVSQTYEKQLLSQRQERIATRQLLREQRKLNNLQRILGRALDFCLDENQPDELDPDWFFSFVAMAEDIHSPAMQELWGKIFAVENSKPGSFSLKTLQILRQLTQRDALVFRQAVNIASRRKGELAPKLLLGYYKKKSIWSMFSSHSEEKLNLAQFGLSYPDLLVLMDLGLIYHSEIESGELLAGEFNEWRSAGLSLDIAAKTSGITLVYYKFTSTGTELSKLVNSVGNEHYGNALKMLLAHGFTLR
ncbi:MAG: TIGR03899 family protein [Paraglaciecola sp.]|nr:TIGR03899 family protein [Paraglaciecola sp.]